MSIYPSYTTMLSVQKILDQIDYDIFKLDRKISDLNADVHSMRKKIDYVYANTPTTHLREYNDNIERFERLLQYLTGSKVYIPYFDDNNYSDALKGRTFLMNANKMKECVFTVNFDINDTNIVANGTVFYSALTHINKEYARFRVTDQMLRTGNISFATDNDNLEAGLNKSIIENLATKLMKMKEPLFMYSRRNVVDEVEIFIGKQDKEPVGIDIIKHTDKSFTLSLNVYYTDDTDIDSICQSLKTTEYFRNEKIINDMQQRVTDIENNIEEKKQELASANDELRKMYAKKNDTMQELVKLIPEERNFSKELRNLWDKKVFCGVDNEQIIPILDQLSVKEYIISEVIFPCQNIRKCESYGWTCISENPVLYKTTFRLNNFAEQCVHEYVKTQHNEIFYDGVNFILPQEIAEHIHIMVSRTMENNYHVSLYMKIYYVNAYLPQRPLTIDEQMRDKCRRLKY